jgi:hypothetical protein
MLKRALRRLARARAHEEKLPGTVDARRLSLGWQFNQVEAYFLGHIGSDSGRSSTDRIIYWK